MHLAELLARRPVPASAVFLALTRRCPLSCRHCSTLSTAASGQQPAAPLRRFVASFTPADHPEYLLLTGGEPLLRPALVRTLAETARAAGTSSYLLTGAFFVRGGGTPAPIRAALAAVDHLAVSVDAYHEAEVPRAAVFRLLHETLAAGRDVSVQTCGTGPGDRYPEQLAREVRAEFGDRVPLLAGAVRPVGRARQWLTRAATPRPAGAPGAGGAAGSAAPAGPVTPGPAAPAAPKTPPPAVPCGLAAWPVVGFDGTISACCGQDVLEGPHVPEHLRLGHVASASWPEVRRACADRPVLRALRTRGPLRLSGRRGDYCGLCRSLADRPDILARVAAEAAHPAARLVEQQAAAWQLRDGALGFARRHGDPALAPLVLLGAPDGAPGAGGAKEAAPCPT